MKENEFRETYPDDELTLGLYYCILDNGDVLLDEESMREEFDYRIKEINKFLEDGDKLKEIVIEKINQRKENE